MDSLFNNTKQQQEDSGLFRSNSSNVSDNSINSSPVQLPSLNLPNGGGAIKGIDEKFKVNSITGTSSFTIPIPFSPGRNGFAPGFALTYNSGAGNSAFGLGWQADIPAIIRKTDNGLPLYMDEDESDIFVLWGAEDLVPTLELQGGKWQKVTQQRTVNGVDYTITNYRPRIEGTFARIEKWQNNTSNEVYWRTMTRDNVTSYFGLNNESRISDPADSKRVFEWQLCRMHDDKGNIIILNYKKEDFAGIDIKMNEVNRLNNCTQNYLKKILYGNKQPYYLGDTIPSEDDFLFKAIFDYGEHDTAANIPQDIDAEKNTWSCRKDPFSFYRAGFEMRTYRRCARILMFHCFTDEELPVSPYLVRSLQLFYDETLTLKGSGSIDNGFSFLVKARQNGHLWDDAANHYSTKYLPEIELQYQQHEWNTTVQYVTADNLANAPVGVDDKTYLWIDLHCEGIGGILTEQNDLWYYKSNMGNGLFTNGQIVSPKPSFSGLGSSLDIAELEGDGVKYLVQLDKEPRGFFKINNDGKWEPMQYFWQLPRIKSGDPNLKFIDLTGDSRSDILYTDDDELRWYPSLGEKGFDVPQSVTKALDEEKGPAIVFADASQSIFLADMSGDGLTDIVRIRNGEICYWPNMGYGRFGAKVNMDNPPVFDHPDSFNPAYLRLADIDGSGTTDIIYLGKNDFRVWMNQNGNEWSSAPQVINPFPRINNVDDIAVLDFLGTGTACIVYSSYLENQPLQYIDLMGSKKPALLTGYKNNCGKELAINYRTSTQFYLDDKLAGIPWVTKLPFPVHCISKLTATDKIRGTVFVNTFSYRHGYYDFTEKEFRGFARVEQNDTESFSEFILNGAKNVVEEDLFQPPVKTISWFHTGAYLPNQKLIHQCAVEYFQNTLFAEYSIPEPVLPVGLSPDEYHEALRACKGLPLRTEVYSADSSSQQAFPYTAAQSSVQIQLVQPKADNRYASFMVVPSESISYSYERNPADPKISHSFTLETDELGDITKSAAVVYPRVKRPMGSNAIPDEVWSGQNQLHIVYGETLYTNDSIAGDNYRLRVGYESISYEINGVKPSSGFFFTINELKNDIAATTTIPFEDDFDGSPQKRLSAHARTYFYKDDLSSPLSLGQLSNLGIAFKSYRLAFTMGLVTKYYGTKVTDAMLQDAQYVHSEGDNDWWIQPGEAIFPSSPQDSFYLPVGSKDVFGNETYVQFDNYNLLITKTTDALNNSSVAQNDYRILSPVLITDPNLNRAAVHTDELAMVTRSAVMGKEGAGEGDTLADPTMKMEYDLFNWQNNGKPNYVHTYVREQHGAVNTKWQEKYTYSDGGGDVVLTKLQANPGIAKVWDEATKQVIDVNADPRWIGNGRTIFNNKGNPIKRYESYFSTTSDYEDESSLVETGVTPVMYYDPVGRNIRTDLPNGTFSKTEFDAWRIASYDPNDTVMDSQWYIDRGSPDPNGAEPADPEKRAAWLAAKHYNTPGIAHADSLGRTNYTITDYGNGITTAVYSESDLTQRYSKKYDQLSRNIAAKYANMLGQSIYTENADRGERWVFTDVMGRLVKIWDNNLYEIYSSYDKLSRPISSYVNQNGKETLFLHTVYGDLFSNNEAIARNMKGRVYQMYDQSGVMTVTGIDFKGNVISAGRQLPKEYKQLADWSILDGLTDIPTIQTTATPLLENETFVSAVVLDALNRPVTVTLPDNSIVRPTYNEANFLAALDVKIMGKGSFVNFLADQDYDAKGQRQFAGYGNGTITDYSYDPFTSRMINLLTRLKSTDPDSNSIQDVSYTFDPVGNVTQIRDDAQQTHFFKNAVIYPENKYQYDATYQLIQATGREHAALVANSQPDNTDLPIVKQLPEANDANAVRNYTEKYNYDNCGNIKQLSHIANNGNWTRRYQYEYETNPSNNTNRLKATSLPGDAAGIYSAAYAHNLHGNMTSMPHLSLPDSMQWNFLDQLASVNLGGGGTAYYVYGMGGNRTRKVIERQGGMKIERIYLGAVEIYRETQGNNAPNLERYTLHISDNTGKIAQVDTKTIDTNNSDKINLLDQNNIRYQYANHLGSAMLEANEAGNIISYEEYHPFGTSSYRVSKPGVDFSLKRYRFSGKERDDESGFYYFGARYYAAWLGRWTSSDPGGYVDGLNVFEYCHNNPVLYHDADGRDGKKPLNPLGEVTWRKSGDLSKMSDAEAIDYFEKYAANPKNNVPKFTKGTVTVEWTGEGANRKPVFNAEWLDDSGKPLLPREGEMGYVEKMRKQPKAEYSDPSDKSTRLTENEHTTPNAQNKAINPDYDKNAYRNDATVRSPRNVSLDKTKGDNAASDQIKQKAANGDPINVTDEIDMPSNQRFHAANDAAGQPIRPGSINRGTLEQMNNRFENGKSQTLPEGETINDPVIEEFNPASEASAGGSSFLRYGGGGLVVIGTGLSAYSFYKDVSNGRWGSATLSGSSFVGGGLIIGGWAAGSTTLVAAGEVIAAPAAVVGAGVAGWEFGKFINENSGIGDTAQSTGEWAQHHLWDNVYFGATVAGGTAVVTAPYYAGQAIGNRTYDYFTTDKYTLVPWRAEWWPF